MVLWDSIPWIAIYLPYSLLLHRWLTKNTSTATVERDKQYFRYPDNFAGHHYKSPK